MTLTPTDMVVLLVILLAVGGAILYIIRAKKNGQKCVGCPYSKECSGNCSCEQKK
ncbi:MAG: FeoB-associated Cys-rich membrane protein [Clostridia bacterium]|nr:FeoB-associated Cys-rich membrane protein [Clostridia bacterium]